MKKDSLETTTPFIPVEIRNNEKMKFNIYIQLFEQCNQLAVEIKSLDDLNDESTLIEFIDSHDEIKMETDADLDVLESPEVMVNKIKSLAKVYLPLSKELLLVFRDKISPSIQTKSVEEMHKELTQSLNDEFTNVSWYVRFTSNM